MNMNGMVVNAPWSSGIPRSDEMDMTGLTSYASTEGYSTRQGIIKKPSLLCTIQVCKTLLNILIVEATVT